MNAETLYVVTVLLASGFVSVVAAWLWADDLDRPGRLFTLAAALHLPVGVFVAAELLAPTRQLAVLFYTLHTGLSSAVPLVFVLFALAFTADRRTPSDRLVAGVAAYAAVLFGLEVTNPIHGYVRTGYEVVGTTVPHLSGTPTPLFTVLSLPVFIGYYAAIGILGYRFLVRREGRWRQTLVLFVGFVPPFAVSGLWLSGLLIGPINGAFVIGSSWMVSFAGWAVFRYQLFDLVPLARETVFEALDERVIVVDDDLRLLDYNETAATTFPGLSDAHGESLDRLLPRLLAESPAATEGDTHPFSSTFDRTDGSTPREYTVDVSQLHTGGSVRGYVLVIRDITDRQRHIRDLEQQTAQLERFASTLSHDLRNPLNVARGRTELALEGAGESNLRTALDALDRVDRIIDDLLTLAREGRTIDDRQRVSLVDVVEGAWQTTDTRGATLQLEVAPTVSVYADRTRLQNVFENLFRNSVEHSSTDSRTESGDSVEHGSTNNRRAGADDSVEHETTDSRAESDPVTVTVGRHDSGFYVEDDGPGIPPENREAVLEYEFTTGDGTGLGLAIVDAIAQAHGWSVSVESGRDGGARIAFDDVTFVDSEASVERAPDPVAADADF